MDVHVGRRCHCKACASLPWLFLILIRIKFTNLAGLAEAGLPRGHQLIWMTPAPFKNPLLTAMQSPGF